MKILIVCSGNSGIISPFIQEQANALQKQGITIDYYQIKGKGIFGYLSNLLDFKKKIKEFQPDLIHAHYGLSGLLATLQRTVPVITTFHGSDINVKKNIKFSYLAARLSRENIFVHPDLPNKIKYFKSQKNIIPCGVNINTFNPIEVDNKQKKYLGLDLNKKNILFSSSFDNPVKNYSLAKRAVDLLDDDINLIELKRYSTFEVNLLMNSIDLLLITSHSETGPLVAKEAMACNCPVVSTDVGDIKWLFDNLEGHYITSFEPLDVAEKIKMALDFAQQKGKTQGRERIIELSLDSDSVASNIISVYEKTMRRGGG